MPMTLSGDGTITGLVAGGLPNATVIDADLSLTANSAQVMVALNASGSAPIFACRAWVNFNGTGTVAIRASGNVSSVTDGGVGTYTVNFTTAIQDAHYSYFVQANPVNTVNEHADAATAATTSLGVLTRSDSNVFYDADFVRVAIFR